MNQQNTEKKIYQKWWFWLIILLIVSSLLNKKGTNSASSNEYQYADSHICSRCGKRFTGKGYMFAFGEAIMVTNGQGDYCSEYCAEEANKRY